ncbi:hypothetical protein O1O06_02035 [Grimontia hollisae]|uniref:hypothetical protein n=1 Tax=Grimontia hollisae TaxID=673 RepID=UPI0023D9DFA1|nr:hypothetical protein [Grimontia hollisae]MDF2183550.1 hypothetical protein [Grimontia hollisae]
MAARFEGKITLRGKSTRCFEGVESNAEKSQNFFLTSSPGSVKFAALTVRGKAS